MKTICSFMVLKCLISVSLECIEDTFLGWSSEQCQCELQLLVPSQELQILFHDWTILMKLFDIAINWIAIENENNHKNSPLKRKRANLKEREQHNLCLSQGSVFLNAGKEADAAFETSYISELITKAEKVIHQNPVYEDMLMFYVEYQCDIHCEMCPHMFIFNNILN